MKIRYCIEYINPRHPLYDDGSLNVRHDRVLTLEQAEHDLTIILSFGGKILNLYMGNVVEGKTGEWNPIPMIVDKDDWFTTDWLNTLEVKEVDLEKEIEKYAYSLPHSVTGTTSYGSDIKSPMAREFGMRHDWSYEYVEQIAKHFFELGIQVSNKSQKGE